MATNEYLLIATTDRISAFDVVHPHPIPAKGDGADGALALFNGKPVVRLIHTESSRYRACISVVRMGRSESELFREHLGIL